MLQNKRPLVQSEGAFLNYTQYNFCQIHKPKWKALDPMQIFDLLLLVFFSVLFCMYMYLKAAFINCFSVRAGNKEFCKPAQLFANFIC